MAKQPTELLNAEQLVDLVAEFIKECRQKPKHTVSDEALHLAAIKRADEHSSLAH